MTNEEHQEPFNTVYRGLRAQGWRQSSDGQQCLYRGPYDCKCAAGHVIPDNVYDYSMEGHGIVRLTELAMGKGECGLHEVTRAWLREFGADREKVTALEGMQMCHDGARDPGDAMQKSFDSYAKHHSLTIPD